MPAGCARASSAIQQPVSVTLEASSSMPPSPGAAAAAASAATRSIASPVPRSPVPKRHEARQDAPHPHRPVQPPLRISALSAAIPHLGQLHHSHRHGDGASPLHVLCACDTFKGTLPSDKVGEAVEKGYWQAWAKTRSSATAQSHVLPAVTAPSEEVSVPSPTSSPLHLVVPPLAASLLSAQHPSVLPADAVRFLHTPMSDGGAGLLDSVTYASTHASMTWGTMPNLSPSGGALRLQRVYVPASVPITGPLGAAITTDTGGARSAAPASRRVSFACDVERRVLVVEMAEAAGLTRIARPQDRHPGRTTSYGVGELIRYALAYMAEAAHVQAEADVASKTPSLDSAPGSCGGVRLFLGIGGSSTNDGGLGALQALGLEVFVDAAHACATDCGHDGARRARASTAVPDAHAAPTHVDDGAGVRLARPFRGEDLAHVTRVCIGAEMQCIFPYLPEAATPPTETGTGGDDAHAAPPPHSSLSPARACYITEVCLICDVDNTLVGARGATYAFGPQKCAAPHAAAPLSPATAAGTPPAGAHADSAGVEAAEDAAVGTVTSAAQQQMLDSLEAGMRHASARIVASVWRPLAAADAASAAHAQHAAGEARHMAVGSDKGDSVAEAAVLEDLLYRRGGGGAGGMSGFFRYLLLARYVPGADVVGGLLGLYETPQVAQLLRSEDSVSLRRAAATAAEKRGGQRSDDALPVPAEWSAHVSGQPTAFPLRCPRGCLFHTCDVVVSGEGSFDEQTILSHKTVGRLLEMCTVANAYRLWHHYCDDVGEAAAAWSERRGCRCITDVVVVCGRCGFGDYTHLQSAALQAVCTTLLPLHIPNCCVATAAATSTLREADGANADDTRLHMYLQDLMQSSAFWRACGESSSAPEDDQGLKYLLSAYCVPRVTVLPLTPTLFPVPAAMQQPFLCYCQGDPSERTSRCRRQRRLAPAHEGPLSSAIRSRPPHRERRGHNLAETQESQAGCAATVDVDVTVTCSSFTSELQRLFPWSAAYSLWQQRRRQRRTSATSARSALPLTAPQGEDWVPSEPPAAEEGYDWRCLFIVRYEPHPARLCATPTTQKSTAERGCGGSTAAAAISAARHSCRESRRRSRASQQSQAGIRETPLNTTAAMATESTCESRAVQLWREVLLSSSSRRAEASCPLHESQVDGSSHAALRGAAHTTMNGRQGFHAGARMPAAGITDSPTTRRAGGDVRGKRAAVPSNTLSEAPLPPLFAWTTPPTYEIYHLCGDLDLPRSGAASPAHVYPAQVTQAAWTPLEHRRRRSDIVRRLRRVGRLHAIPGLPQLPPLLLSRERAMPSAEVLDGADDEDMSVAQEDVLVGTVCSLHDYCHYLTGIGNLEDGEAADDADGVAHLSPSHKNQLTTDSPAFGGRSAHVPEMASDCVSGTAGAEKTGRGMCFTNLSKRLQVLGDDDGGKAVLSELDDQQQVRGKHGTATAGIRPRRLYEDVGHHHWSCIASDAFLEEKVRICRRSHEPSRTTAAVSCAHPPAPPQRLHVAAPVPRRQERAAHSGRERAAPKTDAGVLPLSSTSCAALSPAAPDVLEVGCSAAALSASHSLPRTSAASAAARLASNRSLDLSHLYCFLDPPCRLYTEELEDPHTWLVYVHPDVSVQTLPRLWTRAFGEDTSNSSGGAGQEACEGGTTRVLDGRHEVDGRDGRAEHEGVVPSSFYAAVARKRRRQAAEVEMLCRHLLSTTPPRRKASSALLVHPAEVSVSARARSRGRPIAAASTKADTGITSSTPSKAAVLMSDATSQRLPTSATALPHEADGHRQQQQQALACALPVSPLPRGTALLKRRHWLAKPFVLVEELKYGRVVKYSHAELAAPRVL
ncbi:Glycerate kinase family protein [Leishmania donovani]|uniref:Glycerate kinase family protein n=1 Tax=Leishmania donovani TaxID=5661 RepID=A0A504X239_LEIDO|nr:Glycerate kinase family protein [Leishmania donovani]